MTFVGLFWFVAPCDSASIIVKFGKEEVSPNILLTAKVENFGGSFGNSGPENPNNSVIT